MAASWQAFPVALLPLLAGQSQSLTPHIAGSELFDWTYQGAQYVHEVLVSTAI